MYQCERCFEYVLPQYRNYSCGICGGKPPHRKTGASLQELMKLEEFRRCCVCGETTAFPKGVDFKKEECDRCRSVGSLIIRM